MTYAKTCSYATPAFLCKWWDDVSPSPTETITVELQALSGDTFNGTRTWAQAWMRIRLYNVGCADWAVFQNMIWQLDKKPSKQRLRWMVLTFRHKYLLPMKCTIWFQNPSQNLLPSMWVFSSEWQTAWHEVDIALSIGLASISGSSTVVIRSKPLSAEWMMILLQSLCQPIIHVSLCISLSRL